MNRANRLRLKMSGVCRLRNRNMRLLRGALRPLPQDLLRVVLVPAHEGAARQASRSNPRREDSEAPCLINHASSHLPEEPSRTGVLHTVCEKFMALRKKARPANCTGCEMRGVSGNPHPDYVSTSYLGRHYHEIPSMTKVRGR